jgi:hypothetical protein
MVTAILGRLMIRKAISTRERFLQSVDVKKRDPEKVFRRIGVQAAKYA